MLETKSFNRYLIGLETKKTPQTQCFKRFEIKINTYNVVSVDYQWVSNGKRIEPRPFSKLVALSCTKINACIVQN